LLLLLLLLLHLLLLLVLLLRRLLHLLLLRMGDWGRRNRNAVEGRDPMERMELLLGEQMRRGTSCGRSLDPFGIRR
jgi:hypothetical protein